MSGGILIVGTEPLDADRLRAAFPAAIDIPPHHAVDVDAALLVLESLRRDGQLPALALVDLHLPRDGAVRVLALLRREPYRAIRVAAMSPRAATLATMRHLWRNQVSSVLSSPRSEAAYADFAAAVWRLLV